MQKLLLILLGTLIFLPALARDFQYTYEGKNLTYTVTDVNAKTCKVTQNSVSGNLVIPSIAKDGDDEYSVTSIGEWAFYGCSSLTSVIIGNLVESIGHHAFYGCSGLLSIEVSPGNPYYASLDGVLFSENYSELIQFPGGRTGEYAIPTSVTSIGNYAFEYCSGLTSVTIPNSVTSIGQGAFEACSSLTSVNIPSSVISIRRYAFCWCNSLTCIEVSPENPKYASLDGVLFNKDLSTLIQFPGGKTGDYVISNTVISIGERAFCACLSMTSVTIPNSVTSIGEYAFYDCSGLTSVEIPNSVTSIGNSAFEECRGLTSVTIPNSVTSIGSGAFRCCSCLTSVEIGNSVKTIGIQAFGLCHGVTSIEVSPKNPNYASLDRVLFNKDYSTLIQFPGGRTGEYHIPTSVTSIGWGAFNSCLLLTSVNIPNSVISIDDCAFYGCSGLTSVEIPNSVTSIGSGTFANCSGLTSVYYGADEPIEGNYNIFDGVYENATLYMSGKGIVKGRTIDPWKNFAKIEVYDPTEGINAVDADIDFNQPYEVYSLSGAKVSDSADSLAPGIYILRQGNAVKKIAVKQPTF